MAKQLGTDRLQLFFALGLMFAAPQNVSAAPAPDSDTSRPNIVLILAEDRIHVFHA